MKKSQLIEFQAKRLYEEYCKAVGGKAFNGQPLPDWETFSSDESKKIQADGWRQVAIRSIPFSEEDIEDVASTLFEIVSNVSDSGIKSWTNLKSASTSRVEDWKDIANRFIQEWISKRF